MPVQLIFHFFPAKFEENEEKIPTIATLNKFVNDVFQQSEYHQMELLLLDFFKWNVDLPTPVHFMEYYLSRALKDMDDDEKTVSDEIPRIYSYVRKYVHYFLEISLQGLSSGAHDIKQFCSFCWPYEPGLLH